MKITATRFHDFSMGHRVVGHEGACSNLHGHNYRVHFTVRVAGTDKELLDGVGRVIDFSAIKDRLCDWLENNWDHRLLLWDGDEWAAAITAIDPAVRQVPFNPTAENLAAWLLHVVGPRELDGLNVELCRVVVEETRKCSATAEL